MINFFVETPQVPLIQIQDEILDKRNVKLFVHRIDLTHPEISGNKYFKLKYNILEMIKRGEKKFITFGGAYSNHLHAAASAANMLGIEAIGIVRGDEIHPLNPTLLACEKLGMKLFFVTRGEYRLKNSTAFIDNLRKKFGDFYLIPEGGSNSLAVEGCMEILNQVSIGYDIVCTACGTGGTIAGVAASVADDKKVLGFPALRGAEFLRNTVAGLLTVKNKNSFVVPDYFFNYHFGGYAKITNDLLQFIVKFADGTKILLDPIYTGKMMFGIYNLLEKKYFDSNTTIIALHTGGLQGWKGVEQRFPEYEVLFKKVLTMGI